MTIVEPATAADVSATLAAASLAGRRVAVRGGGTKIGWGTPHVTADLVLSTKKLNAVVAHRHGDLTATVQAGAALAEVNAHLARHGQWIPLDPPFADRATIGGIVATNDSGPRRHRYGAPRDLIIGIDFVRGDGVQAKAGGIVVKNVAGYDIARLLTGSFGSLAIIVSATFKLFPVAPASRTVVVDFEHDQPVEREGFSRAINERLDPLLSAVRGSQLTPSAIEIQAPPLRLLVRFETIAAAVDAQAAEAAQLAYNIVGSAFRRTGPAEAGAYGLDLAEGVRIVEGTQEAAIWARHEEKVWSGAGAVVKVSTMPTDVAPTLTWLASDFLNGDFDVVGRAAVGVLMVRIGGDATTQARVITELRGRLAAGRGSAVVVRAPDQLKSSIDVWGPRGDGFALMKAIKQQFDPQGILNPGGGPGGL